MPTTSKRRYLTSIADLEQYADITVTDSSEAYDQIDQAEELIDAYIGHQDKSYPGEIAGKVTGVNSKTVADTSSDTHLDQKDGYFKYCVLEIVSGGGAGAVRPITDSNESNNTVTYEGEAISGLNTTSVYRIYQLGKFPRSKDTFKLSDADTIYKTIPEDIQRATAAQVQFMIEMGANFFSGEDSEMESENIMQYGYTRGSNSGQSAVVRMIAPKARILLRGYKNRTGKLQRENPTWL